MNALHNESHSSARPGASSSFATDRLLQDDVLQSPRESAAAEEVGATHLPRPLPQAAMTKPTVSTQVENFVAERPGTAVAIAAGTGAIAAALLKALLKYALTRRRATSSRTYRK